MAYVHLEKMIEYWKNYALTWRFALCYTQINETSIVAKIHHPGVSVCKYKEVMLMSTYEPMSITGEANA